MTLSRIALGLGLATIAGVVAGAYYLLRDVPAPLAFEGMGITGTVWDASTLHDWPSVPVAGAVVEAYDLDSDSRRLLAHTTTDAWGRYALPISRPAKIHILVSKLPDFEKEQADLSVTDRHLLDFTLWPLDRPTAGGR